MKRAAVISIVAIVGLIGVLAFVERADRWPALENPPRQGEALDSGALQHAQFAHSAEAMARLIREPQNTWSNLAFVFAGALLASRASMRSARMVGAALVAVGAGSFVYHASASRALRHLDVAAMNGLFFATTAFVGSRFSYRMRARIESHIWPVAIAALAFAIFATVSRNFVIFGVKPLELTTVTAVASAILIAALILEAWHRRSIRVVGRIGTAIGLFSAGVVCQYGDRPGGWLLNPDSTMQAHALWHVLSALALLVAIQVLDVRETPNHFPESSPASVTPAGDATVAPAACAVH